MKKKFIIFLLLLVFPLFISALEVDKILISGSKEAYINKEIDLTFSITYKGLDKKSTNGYGIGGYTYQLDFDDNVFVPVNIKEDDFFNKKIYKDENNKYHVIASVKIDNNSKNKCADNTLYCADVKDVITFSIKETTLDKSTVKVYASSTYLYKVGSELNDTDSMIMDSIQNIEKEIKLSKSNVKSTTVHNIVQTINSSSVEKTVTNEIDDFRHFNNEKSNNNLSKLEIEGYSIDFDKHLLTYDVNIPYNVNSLNITATSENENATVNIVGNDNLIDSNHVVEITVTSEDGNKKTYKINALTINEDDERIETNEDVKAFVSGFKGKINAKTIKTLEIVGACLLGVILLIVIIKAILNRKLNKKLKDFDEF